MADLQVIIPLAGEGSRFKSYRNSEFVYDVDIPKPLLPIRGKTMIERVIDSIGIQGTYIFVVRSAKLMGNQEQYDRLIENITKATPYKHHIVPVDNMMNGTAMSCYAAKRLINPNKPLISFNCDQIFHWNQDYINNMLLFFNNYDHDSSVLTTTTKNPTYSFVKTINDINSNQIATKFAEKKVISDQGLVGVHYWRKASFLWRSIPDIYIKRPLIGDNCGGFNHYLPELYISQTLNYMLENELRITTYNLPSTDYTVIGIPSELNNYIDKHYNNDIKLLILDIDGVLTTGRKLYNRNGNVDYKEFNDKDWTAIKRFITAGIKVIGLTGDLNINSNVFKNRLIPIYGCRTDGKHLDKADFIPVFEREYSISRKSFAFIGDDYFDLGMMKGLSNTFCPADAPMDVKSSVRKVMSRNGGNGVIAELFDYLVYNNEVNKNIDTKDVYLLDIKEKF